MFTEQPERRQPAHVRGNVCVAWRTGPGDVHLQADAVNRHALRAQPLHQVVDAIRFRAQPLSAVIVVKEQRLGIGLPGQAEGIGDVLIAELLSEHAIPQPRPIVGNRLVHDVPRDHASAEMFADCSDVSLECGAEFRRGQRGKPTRDRSMPDERMPFDPHAVGLTERDDRISGGEVAAVLLCARSRPISSRIRR